MRLLHFDMVRFRHPENFHNHAYLVRCRHGKFLGIDVQIGSCRWRWLWRLCK